jgi:hypothetical protein
MKIALPKKQDIHQWHRWFAWWPIWDRWADNKVTMIWLETVERRRNSTGFDPGCETVEYWQYRPAT